MRIDRCVFLRDDSGQSLIITATALMCLMGFLALATDVGLLFRDKVNLQKVADAAAIAGAAELSSGNYEAAAQASAAQNGVTNGVNGTVTVTSGTTYHPNSVKVYVTQSETNHFLQLFGKPTTTVGASAVAGLTNGNACMYALDTDPFKGLGITMNGTGNLNIPHCAIYDNASLDMNGNSGSIAASFIGVVGSYSGSGASPTPVTGMVPVPDPMSYWTSPQNAYSAGSCQTNPKQKNGSLGPACYNGLTLNGTTLNPGLYVIHGVLDLNGVTGTGVTFYIDGTKGGSLGSTDGSNLSAPVLTNSGTCTTGAGCNGVLFWDTEVKGKAQQGVAFGPHGSTLSGILYFPNASLKFHGDTTTTLNADIIATSYVFDGTINMNNYVLGSSQSPLFLTPTLLE